jgi:hypothetical protein
MRNPRNAVIGGSGPLIREVEEFGVCVFLTVAVKDLAKDG